MGASKVQDTVDRIAKRLKALNVDFALAGGLAVGVRGHLRLTVDVDLLITSEGLAKFKAACLGRGFVEKFPGSRSVRDTDTGVSIDFLIAGEFPGDGLPKPVRFPDPGSMPQANASYRVVDLRTLIEIKLAAGLSAPDRLQDLADVLSLIRANDLPASYASLLDSSVRGKYREIWDAAQRPIDR
jgi:hypothetical protein